MQIELKIGPTESLQLTIADEKVTQNIFSELSAIESLSEVVVESLTAPLDFPTLDQATVPGDQLLFTVDPDLPRQSDIIRGIIQYFVQANLTDRNITFLVPNSFDQTQVDTLGLPESAPGLSVTFSKHDAEDREKLSYLGSTKDNHSIMVNRLIGDADMVIPLVYSRCANTLAYYQSGNGLFPAYTDRETQTRFAGPAIVEQPVLRRRRNEEANEVSRMVGTICSLQFYPAANHEIGKVLFGDQFSLSKETQNFQQQQWQTEVAKRSSVVLMTLGASAAQQTWDNVARALSVGSRLVEDHGSIILCTTLNERPGGSIARLAGNDDPQDQYLRLRKDRNRDSMAALQLAHSLDQAKVYLHSQLPDGLIEDLNMVPVSDGEELSRICDYFDQCLIVHDAQFMDISVAGEELEDIRAIDAMK